MQKRLVLLVVLFSLIWVFALANPMQAGKLSKLIDLPQGKALSQSRVPPSYTFSKLPTSIMVNYYDYMIGSYNGLPLKVIPQSAGGGYFMTYHGQRAATFQRRAFYTYLDAAGNLINNNEISNVQNREGYSTMAVDPVSGKPFYAWHANADADATLEVQVTSDAFIVGIAGLFNDLQVAIDNPYVVVPPVGTTTTDNEFIWPTAQIGPSPIAGKRRVYLAARNSITHNQGPSENVMIAYADFNADDIEMGTPLVWNSISIPLLNQWNVDAEYRRPNCAITADNAGNLYYAGYHTSWAADGTTPIHEPDMDVFVCPNYGQGTWTRYSAPSDLPTWNPPAEPGTTEGYFADSDTGVPYTNNQLNWSILNSTHLNAVMDSDNKLHVLGTWGLTTPSASYYYAMQFVKEFVFDPISHSFTINEVYPQKSPADTYNQQFTPWDTEAPWGAVDEYGGNATEGYYPLMASDWPFCHWDYTAHASAMFFHYGNTKITEGNQQEMMAAVWQNSLRARNYNLDEDPAYAAYANTPEIFISVSPNNGETWSEPIILNNVDTPQLAGIKPMWVYPADKVIFTGMQGNRKIGKLGLMFYDDFTWGSGSIADPYHPTVDGGRVMFTELQIIFPESGTPPPTDPFGEPVVLSGSMSVMAQVSINGAAASNGDVLAAFVNVGGVPQLRGKEDILVVDNIAGCLLLVNTETNGEAITFKVWDQSANTVYDAPQTLNSEVNGVVGSWPNNLYQVTAGTIQTVALPAFNPVAGTYTTAQNVVLSCSTPAAVIHYTTDGTEPTEASPTYTNPINIPLNTTMTIKAKGYKSGWTPSATATANYIITGTVATPGFNPAGGTYNTAQNVTISCATAGATIRYTTNGIEPTESSPAYSTPISIPLGTSMTIKAKGYKAGWTPSPTASASYEVTGTVDTPTFAPPAGSYTAAQNVVLSCATAGATIRFTTNGAEPSETSTAYTSPINVPENSSLTIKAKGYKTGWNPSATATASYVVTGTVATPSFAPPAGNYNTAQDVVISCATAGATLRFTTNGTEPTEASTVYSTPINVPLGTSMTIKAKGYKTGWTPSVTASGTYNITGTVADPSFDPPAGTYTAAQNVEISCTPPGATIRYTTNGTEPTEASPAYSTPISIPLGTSMTIKARGYKTGWVPSSTVTASYSVTGTVATPAFNPVAGTYTTSQLVLISCATPDAVIRFTTNNTDPTEASPVYSTPLEIPLNTTLTIKAKGFKTAWNPSPTAAATYIVTGTVATPEFNPPGGSYSSAQNIAITCATAGAQIRYTLDGNDPTPSSLLYSGPVPLTTATTLKARAYKADWTPSAINIAVYQIVVATPEDLDVPAATGIAGIFPNPFQNSTTIKLGIKDSNQPYRIQIFNIKGECVYEQGGVGKGYFDLVWDGRDSNQHRVSSGVYMLRFSSGSHQSVKKMLLQ